MRYSVLCRIHYRYLIVGIYYCYRYLRVHCVQKGPVHPLLELPQPRDPVPIPLPRKHGIIQCYRYLLVDCVEKGPVHPLLELPQPRDPVPIPLPINMGLNSVIDTYLYTLYRMGLYIHYWNIRLPKIPSPYHYQYT